MSESECFAVEPGWVDAHVIDNPGPTYRLLTYADGTVRFEHRCDRGERGTIICALRLDSGHSGGCRCSRVGPASSSDEPMDPAVRAQDRRRNGRNLVGSLAVGSWARPIREAVAVADLQGRCTDDGADS